MTEPRDSENQSQPTPQQPTSQIPTIYLSPRSPASRYTVPETEQFRKRLEDPDADTKDLHHDLMKLIGQVAIILIEESCQGHPSFTRAQTASRAVEGLRALAQTLQERQQSFYKDRLDFENPRFVYVISALFDLIEETLTDTGITEAQRNNFFIQLQARMLPWEEKMKKSVNSVSFNVKARTQEKKPGQSQLLSDKSPNGDVSPNGEVQ